MWGSARGGGGGAVSCAAHMALARADTNRDISTPHGEALFGGLVLRPALVVGLALHKHDAARALARPLPQVPISADADQIGALAALQPRTIAVQLLIVEVHAGD